MKIENDRIMEISMIDSFYNSDPDISGTRAITRHSKRPRIRATKEYHPLVGGKENLWVHEVINADCIVRVAESRTLCPVSVVT